MKDWWTHRTIHWGHLALLALIGGVVVAYLLDARGTSLRTNNLLLVQPASIIALLLAAAVLPQCFRRAAVEPESEGPERRGRFRGLAKVAALAAAFGALVFSLETVGFDVATFLFTGFGLWICGERKLWVIGLFSAVFTAVIVYGYKALVPYPFPLSVL